MSANLTLVRGRGRPISAEGRADEAELELAVIRDETLASARRMRLVLQRPLWSADVLAPLAKPLLEELARIETRLAEPPEGRAA